MRDRTRPVIVAARLEQTPPPFVERILSAAENQRGQRFRFREDRHSYIATHALKRLLAHWATGLPAASLNFQSTELGKPFLSGSNLAISLSHTRSLAVVALSWQGAIGVDAETLTSVFEPLGDLLALGVLSAPELDLISGADKPPLAFLQLWTAKEAISKAIGLGLSMPFTDITLSGSSAHAAGESWHLDFKYPTTSNIVAVATTSQEPVISFQCCGDADIWQHLQLA